MTTLEQAEQMLDDCASTYANGAYMSFSQSQCAAIRDEILRLRQRETILSDMVEDVAIGTKLTCGICGQLKPCICDK